MKGSKSMIWPVAIASACLALSAIGCFGDEYPPLFVTNNSKVPITVEITKGPDGPSPVIKPFATVRAFGSCNLMSDTRVTIKDARNGKVLWDEEVPLVRADLDRSADGIQIAYPPKRIWLRR